MEYQAGDLLRTARVLIAQAYEKEGEGELAVALEIFETAKKWLLKYCTHEEATVKGRKDVEGHLNSVDKKIKQIRKEITLGKAPPGYSEDLKKLTEEFKSRITKGKGTAKWNDIGGYKDVKKILNVKLVRPLQCPNLFANTPPIARNILFFGPPGCGKTLFAKAIASEVDANFIQVFGSDIFSRWVGVTENRVRALFAAAREKKPCVIFIDEIDCVLSRSHDETTPRDAAVTEFLATTDSADTFQNNGDVILLGGTNQPWRLDCGAFRRFGSRIYIPLPDVKTRRIIIKTEMLKSDLEWNFDVPFKADKKVAEMTEFFSGADLSLLVNDLRDYRWHMLDSAKYFKLINLPNGIFWAACSSTEEGAQKFTVDQLDKNRLHLPSINWSIMTKCISSRKPTLNRRNELDEDSNVDDHVKNQMESNGILEKFEQFNEAFGLKIENQEYDWEENSAKYNKDEFPAELQERERTPASYPNMGSLSGRFSAYPARENWNWKENYPHKHYANAYGHYGYDWYDETDEEEEMKKEMKRKEEMKKDERKRGCHKRK